MEEEIKTLTKVWIFGIICISYCYYIPSRIKTGVPRLLSVLPISALFLILPLFLSSIHFCGATALFFSGVGNLKLIFFCFDQGPLYPLPSNLIKFISFTCFPVKLQPNPKSQNHSPKWFFAIEVAIYGVVLHAYHYKQNLHPVLLLALHALHLYLDLEVLLMVLQVLDSITLGCDIEPIFNQPYLATSLQDFWGRRWNLFINSILRSGVYKPVCQACQYLMISSDYAMLIGVLATFVVSGVFHEVFLFYITREAPTGELTLFFVLHGVCTAMEVVVKRTAFARTLVVNVAVSRLVTVGFVLVSSGWLFFPQIIQNGVMERRANETLMIFYFVKSQLIRFL